MRRRTLAILAVLVIALLAVIIATRDTGRPSDFSTANQPSGIGAVVRTGDGWTLETYEEPGRCYLLRVNGATTYCQSTEYPPGSSTWRVFEGEGHRLAVVVFGSAEPVTGRWFSSNHRASPVTSYELYPDVVAFVIDLERGEDPFGLQVLDGAGGVISAVSFVR